MSLLADFGAGFFNDQARQADERRQLSIQDALEKMRRKRQIEDEQRREQMRVRSRADELNATGQPYQRGGLLMQRRFDVSDDGRLTSQDQEIGPAPLQVVKRYEVKRGANIETEELLSDGSTRIVGTAPRFKANAAGVSDGGADRRASESNRRRDRDSLAIETERRLSDYRAEIKGISTERDEETGMSQFDQWLMDNAMPTGQTKAQAMELLRKRVRDEIGGDYGAEAAKPRTAAPSSRAAPSVAPEPPKKPSSKGLPRPKTEEEYKRLPSGTTFIDPDGVERVKP